MLRLCDLEKKDVNKFSKNILSFYPLIYHKINRYNNINFKFKNPKIEIVFNNLIMSDKKDVSVANKEIFELLKNLFFSNEPQSEALHLSLNKRTFNGFNKNFTENIKDFCKIFFAYNYATKDIIFEARIKIIEEKIKKIKDNPSIEKKLEASFFLHDGWWNNYYGPLIDTITKKVFDSIYKNKKQIKKMKKFGIESYHKFMITYAYRLYENKEYKKAFKIIKKDLFFLKTNLRRDNLKKEFPVEIKGFLKIVLMPFFLSMYTIRYKTNSLMFVYRTMSNKRKKKRIIKKIERMNSLTKTSMSNIFFSIIRKKETNLSSSMSRPQHLLKLIEIKTDAILLFPKRKKELNEEIIICLIDFFKSLIFSYYNKKRLMLNYFIIMEMFFVLFYYLENVLKINIQEF